MTDSTPFFILSEESLTIFRDGKLAATTSEVSSWEDIKAALAAKQYDEVFNLIDQASAIADYVSPSPDLEVTNGEVNWRGVPIHGVLVDRILTMRREGFDIEPMTKFLVNLQANPSYSSREQLYGFLEANKLPITPDGCFMAYKRITHDWKDCYTREVDNRLGTKPIMERSNVDDDPNRTCSQGYHVCSLEYLTHYQGARLVGVKVNPKDVVSVPTDYNNSKMRVCAYEVIEELPMSLIGGEKDFWDASVTEGEGKKTLPACPQVGFSIYDDLWGDWWGGVGWTNDESEAQKFEFREEANSIVAALNASGGGMGCDCQIITIPLYESDGG